MRASLRQRYQASAHASDLIYSLPVGPRSTRGARSATHMVGTFKLLFNALHWSAMGD